jgi:hypothetical protein
MGRAQRMATCAPRTTELRYDMHGDGWTFMRIDYLITGLALEVGALVVGWLCIRLLYSMGLFGTLVLAVPMFMFGIWFVMKSGAWWPVRVALSFWIVGWPLFYLGVYGTERITYRDEVFLIPAGYRGKVTVMFGVADGADAQYQGGARVFQIGTDGILRTRAGKWKFASHSLNQRREEGRRFYELDGAGGKSELGRQQASEWAGLAEDRVIVTPVTEHDEGRRILKVEYVVWTVKEAREWLGRTP